MKTQPIMENVMATVTTPTTPRCALVVERLASGRTAVWAVEYRDDQYAGPVALWDLLGLAETYASAMLDIAEIISGEPHADIVPTWSNKAF